VIGAVAARVPPLLDDVPRLGAAEGLDDDRDDEPVGAVTGDP
jgi:hypothetical protein